MDNESNAFNFSLDSLFLPKEAEASPSEYQKDSNTNDSLNVSLDFPELIELVAPIDTTGGNAFLFENPSSSGNFNFFGDYNNFFNNTSADEPWKLFREQSNSNGDLKVKVETPMFNIKKEENPAQKVEVQIKPEDLVKEQEAEEPSSPVLKKQKTSKITKKTKKNLLPEELEEKKKQQLERRLIKNRRTADISRKRKKAKKVTLQESLKKLSEDNKILQKQSIEFSAENRVLKSEYLALMSLIQNTPKLSKMFDKISNLAVSQPPEKLVMANTASAASVYLLNIIYSIHQTWNLLKTVNNESVNQTANPSLQNIPVN